MRDGPQAVAWLEKQLAAGLFDSRSLAGTSSIRQDYENLIFLKTGDGNRSALLDELRASGLGEADRTEVLRGLDSGQVGRLSQGPGAWMEALSPAEAVAVAEGISKNMNSSAHPEVWFDWMGKSLPPEQWADTSKPPLTKWISDDYARMMANRFPDTAKNWANTLPEGPEKRRLLEEIK